MSAAAEAEPREVLRARRRAIDNGRRAEVNPTTIVTVRPL
jgi:hypothetical protein